MLQAFKVLGSCSAEHLGPVEDKAAGNRMHWWTQETFLSSSLFSIFTGKKSPLNLANMRKSTESTWESKRWRGKEPEIDHPGTNCPFYTVHTGRLLFGWERTHCLQRQWLFTAQCGLSSEESLFQNRLAWCLWLPTPFLSMESSMDKCLMVHPMQPFPVTSGIVSGLE